MKTKNTKVEKHGMARYVFYYVLALFTLSFTAIGLGQILFQIINSIFPETTFSYDTGYVQEVLRFGLSSVIIASPIYFFITWLINRDLMREELKPDAGIRKWLSYLILLISSFVVIGFLIGLLNDFLSGELTTKFVLKALTAIIIASAIFSYYLFDITRKIEKNCAPLRYFAVIFILVVIAAVTAGLFFIDSPSEARGKKEDAERVYNLQQISYGVENYYRENKKLPLDLSAIQKINPEYIFKDPVTGELYEYRVIGETTYNLCAKFTYSNRDQGMERNPSYYNMNWMHEKGYFCFEKKVVVENAVPVK